MSTTRMIRYFVAVILIMQSCLLISAERSEMTSDFVPATYVKENSVKSGLPLTNANEDMPEFYDRKYTFSDHDSTDSLLQETNGFRLQIFRTEDLNEAKRRESIYISTFGEENVILIFEKPFYRIRIGRFRNKEEAEEFQQSLGHMGIHDAIIIPDKVSVLMPVNIKNN